MIKKRFINNQVELRVYSTRNQMRRGLIHFGESFVGNTEAMVIPCSLLNVKTNERLKRVYLFIHQECTLPTLVHESLHVATSLARFHKKRIELSQRRINLTEERLAYYQQWVLQEILKVFHPKQNSSYVFNVKDIEDWAKTSFRKL